MTYIEDHRASYGVEPICRLLEIAPSSYYAATRRPPSARDLADAELAGHVARIHANNLGVYGVRKTTAGARPGRDHRGPRPDLAPDARSRARGGHPLPAHPDHHLWPRSPSGRPIS